MPNLVPIKKSISEIWPFFNFGRQLAFKTVGHFNYRYGSEGEYALACQMLCQSDIPLPRYSLFRFLPSDAMLARNMMLSCDHPPVTRRFCNKMAKCRITQTAP